MVQCPEAHLFCVSCMTTYSETLLGAHDPKIVCMDQSGCKLAFPESELRRFLSPKLIQLYERVKQQKEIESAGLDNLEECPFCDYKVVIENEQEKLFRCENAECGAVSCRSCKKLVSPLSLFDGLAMNLIPLFRTIYRRAAKVGTSSSWERISG